MTKKYELLPGLKFSISYDVNVSLQDESIININTYDIKRGVNVTHLASSIKMCYASLTKGTSALLLSLILLADKLEVLNYLSEELEYSQKDTFDKIINSFPSISNKSHRWIAEMEEIASTYVDKGLNPGVFDNASYMYRLLSENKKQFSKLINENF